MIDTFGRSLLSFTLPNMTWTLAAGFCFFILNGNPEKVPINAFFVFLFDGSRRSFFSLSLWTFSRLSDNVLLTRPVPFRSQPRALG